MAEMQETQEAQAGQAGRRCFVGNLAWRTSWQDLKDAFRECGTVVYANVMQDHNGRSKGWGIVEFETPEEAAEACAKMNGADIGGRTIMVREDREDREIKRPDGEEGGRRPPPAAARAPAPRKARPPRDASGSSGLQVVIQGIPWSYGNDELAALFTDYNSEYQIESAEVQFGRDNRSRGYGIVRFVTPELAQLAISDFNNYELEGRYLTVKLDAYA